MLGKIWCVTSACENLIITFSEENQREEQREEYFCERDFKQPIEIKRNGTQNPQSQQGCTRCCSKGLEIVKVTLNVECWDISEVK